MVDMGEGNVLFKRWFMEMTFIMQLTSPWKDLCMIVLEMLGPQTSPPLEPPRSDRATGEY